MINAIVDGVQHSGVESVTAGGKTATLTEVIDLEDKEISITENGDTEVTPSAGKDGIGSVIVHTNVQGAGGIDALLYTKAAPQFGERYPSENPVIYCPLVASWGNVFWVNYFTNTPYRNITVKSDTPATGFAKAFWVDRPKPDENPLETVTIDIADLSRCTDYFTMINDQANFRELKGTPLDFTNVTNAGYSTWIKFGGNEFAQQKNLVKARYKANTLHVNHDIRTAKFTDDTLVSIANGLQSGAHTITLHADMKTRCQAIMGTVSQTADDTGTYSLFTADSSGAAGSVSLEYFITTTKGWTIA